MVLWGGMAGAYAAYQDPKGAGVLVLCLGILLLVVGLWVILETRRYPGWLLVGLGAVLGVVGWLVAFRVRWSSSEK